jgi:hypothetical protein
MSEILFAISVFSVLKSLQFRLFQNPCWNMKSLAAGVPFENQLILCEELR